MNGMDLASSARPMEPGSSKWNLITNLIRMPDSDWRSGPALTPPYISFLGFKLLIRLLKKDGIPQRIDRSILRGVPNAAPNQVAAALGYLGLTDADGRPQPMLHRLVETFGT